MRSAREHAGRLRSEGCSAATDAEHMKRWLAARKVLEGIMTPALAEAAFSLRTGWVSSWVALADGLHLVRGEDHTAALPGDVAAQRER